jgi:hypothetical protein
MVDITYQNAYSELLEIFSYINLDDYNKIPKEKINFFIENCNKNYKFRYDPQKTLDENNVSKKTKEILAFLFCEYWATEKQKEKINNYDKQYQQLEESKKAERYNLDNIFKSNIEKTLSDEIEKNNLNESTKNLEIVVYKEPKWYKKIFEKILKIFKK